MEGILSKGVQRKTVEKEEKQWKADSPELHAHLEPKMDKLFKSLQGILDYGCSVSSKSDSHKRCLKSFQLEISWRMNIPEEKRIRK